MKNYKKHLEQLLDNLNKVCMDYCKVNNIDLFDEINNGIENGFIEKIKQLKADIKLILIQLN